MTIREYATNVHLAVKGDVTYDNLKRYITREGVRVVEYGSTTAKGNDILTALNLTAYAERRLAFSYKDEEYDLIFIKEGLNGCKRLYLLAHEIAHKLAGHATINGLIDENDTVAELEANEFQTLLLNPEYLTPAQSQAISRTPLRGRVYVVCIIVVAVVALVAVAFAFWPRDSASAVSLAAHGQPPATSAPTSEVTAAALSVQPASPLPTAAPTAAPARKELPDEVQALIDEDFGRKVYVTATGGKYHKPDCQYLSNRKYYEITLKEAMERRLTACKVCKP